MSPFATIAVAGAGAWGTALANVVARAGRRALLWARDPVMAEAIETARENAAHFPGVRLADRVHATGHLSEFTAADAVLLVVPAQALREVAVAIGPLVRPGTPLVACAKGIERGTDAFMTQVIAAAAPDAVPAILSGPSFAADVAAGLPTAVTLAAADEALAARLAGALGSPGFRVYHSDDVRGVEIGGAAKNVLAIAAGIAQGRRLGPSAVAALTTRGFAELARFGRAYGARAETLMGLSGLGDLILTCAGPQSRNFALGLRLGAGAPLAKAGGGALAEGAFTAPVLVELAAARGVEMPIAAAVEAVLAGRLDIDGAIERLLTRPQRSET